jgi:phospholipid/cholesterol/gamma-HCH transport system substrate-binding protein
VQIVSEGMLGGKVLEIRPPAQRPGGPTPDMSLAGEDDLLAGEKTPDLDAVLAQASAVLDGAQNGEGTLGKLLKDPEAYNALVALLRNGNEAVDQGKATMGAIQRTAEGVQKSSWLGHVDDPIALLVRPASKKDRRHFGEADLFEPGRAVLTAAGRKKLDDLRPWLKSFEDKSPEVVVVSYADPAKKGDPRLALIVTKMQSEAVVEHMRKSGAYRVGWFSSYKVAPPLGMGVQQPPEPEPNPLPAARVEVVVFVPQP